MEDGMERRLLVSFALSIFVLFAFSWYYSTTTPEEPGAEVPAETVEASAETPVAPVPALPPGGPPEPAAPETAEAAAEAGEELPAQVVAGAAESLQIETPLYTLRVSNVGGVLESIRLNGYDGVPGEPLELLNPAAGAVTGWPLAIRTGDAALDETIAGGLFLVEREASGLRMEYADAGVRVVKTLRVDADRYRIDIDAQVVRNGSPVPFSIVWQGGFGDQSRGYEAAETNIVYRDGASFERLNAGNIEDPDTIPATGYVGIEDRYFAAVFVLADPRPPVVRVDQVVLDEGADPVPIPRLEVPYAAPVGIYIGPQQQGRLADVDPALASVIDYGFFEILARPFLFGLALIHDYVGNWGWSIILLTIFINFVFFPLRLKQQLSMQKMQAIQPQMRTLQDRYKKLKPNDPRRQEVQAEMMGLYKKHGVNPLGGCLPLLLQMPFLIAVFSLLQVSVELRQAPWILWISDLSVADPYYVLPVVFGVAMFAQQKLMPAPTDPTQARIMMIMPIMLTVLFFKSQSGLMVYWITSTAFGVGQQFLIRKYWGPQPKNERSDRRKSDGKETATSEAPVVAVEAEDVSEDGGAEGSGRRRRRRKK